MTQKQMPTMRLRVKFRLFINTFNKEFGRFLSPELERFDRSKVIECALGDVVVVGIEVVRQG